MSPRAKEYQHEVRYEFDRGPSFIRYIRFGFDLEAGKPVRCMIQYEVDFGDRTFALMRFDTADDGYHRHSPGLLQPGPERTYLPGVPSYEWVDHAIDEIKQYYPLWETKVQAPWL